jgi:CheY-like chemotaxis protein
MGRGGYFAIDSLHGVYVLVVDAERDSGVLLSSIFRYAGAFVVTVAAPAAALDAMKHVKPDALVVNVPSSQDGETFTDVVRSLKPEAGGVLPIVAIATTPRDRARLLDAGFSAVLIAPVDPWELCRLVASFAAQIMSDRVAPER